MFSFLFDTIFPAVADFFMNLIAVAQLQPSALLNAIEYQLSYPEGSPIYLFLDSVNFWTGQSGYANPIFYGLEFSFGWLQTAWGRAIGLIMYPLLSFFFAPAMNVPLWISLPICLAVYGLIFGFIKFLIDMIIAIKEGILPF